MSFIMNIFSLFGRSLVQAVFVCLVAYLPTYSSDEVVPSSRHPFDPNVLSSKIYSEVYTLDALYDDHTFIQTQMIVTNIGLGDSNAACEMLVLRVGDKPNKTCKRFKKNGWKFSGKPDPTLSIGSCCLAQEGESTKCTMAIDGTTASFFLDRPPQSGKNPETVVAVKASKRFYTDEVLIPWTRLRTTLRTPGFPEKQLQGYGMLVHSRSIGYPKDFSRGWIFYYGCSEGNQYLANFHFPVCKASDAIGWTWKSQDEAPKPMVGLQMAMNGPNKESILPTVSAPQDFVIAGQQNLFRFSIIEELGPILGCIVRLIVGNPVTHYYWARAQVAPGEPPIDGVLEVMNLE